AQPRPAPPLRPGRRSRFRPGEAPLWPLRPDPPRGESPTPRGRADHPQRPWRRNLGPRRHPPRAPTGESMSAAIRVLLVEDQDPVRTSLERIVTEAPGLALAASVASGEAALEAFAEARPSVVLCDLGLPGIDGVETCSRLKTL